MVDRAVSPVIGVTLLIAVVVGLAATAFVFVTQFADQPGEPPRVAFENGTEQVGRCEFTAVEATAADQGLVFYRQDGERVTLDDDGDGQTEAGESIRIPPGKTVTLVAVRSSRSSEAYVVGEVTGRATTGCLSAAGSAQPDVQTRHGIRYDVIDRGGSGTVGNSLNEVTLTYEAGSGVDMGSVDTGDVAAAGFDRDGDPEIDVSVLSGPDDLQSVSTSNGGRTVQFQFTGNYNVMSGDEIIVRFDDAGNPTSAGTYDVTVDINGDVSKTGNITVG